MERCCNYKCKNNQRNCPVLLCKRQVHRWLASIDRRSQEEILHLYSSNNNIRSTRELVTSWFPRSTFKLFDRLIGDISMVTLYKNNTTEILFMNNYSYKNAPIRLIAIVTDEQVKSVISIQFCWRLLIFCLLQYWRMNGKQTK